MRHGSLFSGIGGFDLAAEWMGWKNVFHCEWNPFGQKVLNHYWPNAESFTDITKSDFTKYANTIDILTGGFPCQPYSLAGKRKGKEDERHLWPEMLRAIREISPRWVVGENVRGLTNWNGGVVFDEVQADLETEGYEVLPFLLPAAGVNAPHERYRVWFVAHSSSAGTRSEGGALVTKTGEPARIGERAYDKHTGRLAQVGLLQQVQMGMLPTPTVMYTREDWTMEEINQRRAEVKQKTNSHTDGMKTGNGFGLNLAQVAKMLPTPMASDCGEKVTGLENQDSLTKRARQMTGKTSQLNPLFVMEMMGFPPDWDTTAFSFSKWRNESIKAGGNAIVPQVAYEIFKAIEQYDLSFFCPTC